MALWLSDFFDLSYTGGRFMKNSYIYLYKNNHLMNADKQYHPSTIKSTLMGNL